MAAIHPSSDIWKGLSLTREIRADGTVSFFCFMPKNADENKPKRCGLQIELSAKHIMLFLRRPTPDGKT